LKGPDLKKDWTPTESSFQKFLHWLDEGVDSSGEKYLEMRRRLVAYFDRKNSLSPDELADETLARVAQKLEERGQITDLSPAHYCYITAKFVFLEDVRHTKRSQAGLEEISAAGQSDLEKTNFSAPKVLFENQEQRFDCLDRCLKKLSTSDSQLILEYYQGEQQEKIQRRRQLSEKLGLSANALSIRACRIRSKVETCVKECCESK
jgi:DNA-directed RNA polymerase specialized sigma24 family protein